MGAFTEYPATLGFCARVADGEDFLVRPAGVEDQKGVVAVFLDPGAVVEDHGAVVIPVILGNRAEIRGDGVLRGVAGEDEAFVGVAGDVGGREAFGFNCPTGLRLGPNVALSIARGVDRRRILRADIQRDEKEDFGGRQDEHDTSICRIGGELAITSRAEGCFFRRFWRWTLFPRTPMSRPSRRGSLGKSPFRGEKGDICWGSNRTG